MHLDDDIMFEQYETKQKRTHGQTILYGLMNKYFEKPSPYSIRNGALEYRNVSELKPKSNRSSDYGVDIEGFIEEVEEKIIFKKLMTLEDFYKEIDKWNQELQDSEYSEDFIPIEMHEIKVALLLRKGESPDKALETGDEGALMMHMKELGMIPQDAKVTTPAHVTVEHKQ